MPTKKAAKSAKNASKQKAVGAATRAGISIPPAKIERLMRRDRLNGRIGRSASVYMAAVLDYIANEILETSGDMAEQHKKKRINPRHLKLALDADNELMKLTSGSIIHQGGFKQHIEEALLPAKKGKKKAAGKVEASQEV